MTRQVSTLFCALLAAGGLSCKTEPSATIVVALSSEAPVPRGIDTIQVTVMSRGEVKLNRSYPVGPDATRLPGTILVERSADSPVGTTVTVIVRGIVNGQEVVSRRATLGFEDDKQKLLRMPLQFACHGVTCGANESCRAGACVPDATTVEKLPDFDEAQVFPKPGACFDRDACIEKTEHSTPLAEFLAAVKADPTFFDKTACTLPTHDPKKPGSDLNMGFVWAANPDSTWTVVDSDLEEGWQFADAARTRIKLAPGLCAELKKDNPRIKELVTATGCPPKPPTMPECRPTPAKLPSLAEVRNYRASPR